MFKQIFGKFTAAKHVETQRETIERALGEVNALVAGLAVKPTVTFDPETGEINLSLPDQMPDEALALPAPDPASEEDAKQAA
jgi:hypothetical protein